MGKKLSMGDGKKSRWWVMEKKSLVGGPEHDFFFMLVCVTVPTELLLI